jgi:hypothetical protein
MNSKILSRLAKTPRDMMVFQASSRLPKVKAPQKTPLWELLNSMNPRERSRYISVQLSPELGYNSFQKFNTGEHLFRWLGGNQQIGEWESNPSEGRVIRGFSKRLSKVDLETASVNHPAKLAKPIISNSDPGL